MSKNYWIFGDSWGTPNFCRPMPGYRARNHVSELIADAGHKVENFAENGTDNYRSVRYAKNFVNHEFYFKPDYILWFHTSTVRDANNLPHDSSFSGIEFDDCLDRSLHIAAEFVYKEIQDLADHYGAKLLIIEGHGEVMEPEFSNILRPDFFIKNWRAEILNMPELPNSPWVSQIHDLESRTTLTPEQIQTEVKKLIQIEDAIRASDLFVDNIHPGDKANIDLFYLLKEKGYV